MRNVSTLRGFSPQFRTELSQSSSQSFSHVKPKGTIDTGADYQFLIHPEKGSIYSGEQLSAHAPELQLPFLLHPRDTKELIKLLLTEHTTKAPAQISLTGHLQALDGINWITCTLTARPLPASYRDLLGWHVVANLIHTEPEIPAATKGEQVLFILSQLYNTGLWQYSPHNEVLELDVSLQKLLNLDRRRLKIQDWFQYIHTDDVKRLLKKVFELQRKGGLFQMNVRYQGPASKRYRYLTLSAASFANTETGGFYLTGLCYDGTHQQRLQSKNLLNKIFLDEAQSIGNIGCFEWQPGMNQLQATQQLKDLTGLSKEEDFTFEYLKKVLLPEDLATLENAYTAFLSGEQSQEISIRFKKGPGTLRTLWIQAKAFYQNGQIASLTGIIQDVTDKVDKQVQIHAKDRLIGGFLKNLPVSIITINKKEQIVSIIGNGLHRAGLDRRKYLGTSVSELSPGFIEPLKQIFTGASQNFVTECVTDSGTVSLFNYFYFDEERDLAVGFSLDITKLKRAELAEAHLTELENRHQLMETFVHAVAHDLRSPVVNLDMLLSFFKEDTSPSEQQKYISAMNNGIQHLKRTLDALIEILRIEKDSTVAADEINFQDLLQELEHEYGEKLSKAGGSLSVYLQCEAVRYNRAYLSSVLRNLISNAIKYSYPERPPQISICTELKGDVVLLLVQDNGMGMDLKKWGHLLFKPFKRLNNHRKGTGIGLHLVKQIIEKNGGKIKVKSEPGMGTTFFCFLRPYK